MCGLHSQFKRFFSKVNGGNYQPLSHQLSALSFDNVMIQKAES